MRVAIMPNRPNFPIPEVIDPPKMCFQMCIPDDPDWKHVIAGLLDQLGQWYNWERDDEQSGRQLAQVWRKLYNDIDWSNMSCCCPEPVPVRYRYDGTTLERSTDGGVTWEDAPDYDYRQTSIIWPKPSELGIPSSKCQAADSVVATFRDEINEQITEDMAAAAILGAVAAALLFFLSDGTTAAITPQIMAVVSAILAAGVSAWQAAFTTSVWDNFRCLIFDNMNSENSIDQAGIDAVYSGLDDPAKFTGIVVPTLKGYVGTAGYVGINNMMAQNNGDPDADCCEEGCADNWSIVTGNLIGQTETYIDVQTVIVVGLGYVADITTPADNVCCNLIGIELIDGIAEVDTFFWFECGTSETSSSIAPPNGHCIWRSSLVADAVATYRFTFSSCA